jgi:hypothetical protein
MWLQNDVQCSAVSQRDSYIMNVYHAHSVRIWTDSSTLSSSPSTTITSLHLSIRTSRLPVVLPRLLPPLLASTTIVETTSAETSTTRWLRKRKIKLLLCCHFSDPHPDIHHTDLLPSSSNLSWSTSSHQAKTQQPAVCIHQSINGW